MQCRPITSIFHTGPGHAGEPGDFITAVTNLQKACGVSELKMSDYGITRDELDTLAANARATMGGLFEADPCNMPHADCVGIYEKAYR